MTEMTKKSDPIREHLLNAGRELDSAAAVASDRGAELMSAKFREMADNVFSEALGQTVKWGQD